MKVKSHTDLKQSRKLTEILPLESADMYLQADDPSGESYSPHFGESFSISHNLFSFRKGLTIPCWSLCALFEVLPKEIDAHAKTMGYYDDTYHCDYIDEDGECIGWGEGIGTTADNLIDAVYEMVINLNKPK